MGKVKKTKQKDFVKKKLKVGKTKQAANNATNLSFQSKQIRINDQVIFDSETVFENNNLTKQYLNEKLAQLNSYSDSVRLGEFVWQQCGNASTYLDGVISIRSILENSANLIMSNMGPVCAGIAKCSIDLDFSVGKEVLHLASDLFEIVHQDQITPFFNVLLVYTSSGISHINESVRFRSLKFAKLLLNKFPAHVSKNSARLVPNFLQLILGREASFTNSKLGMFKSRDEVLEAFEELLMLHFDCSTEKINSLSRKGDLTQHYWKRASTCFNVDYSLLMKDENLFNLNFRASDTDSRIDMSDKKLFSPGSRILSFEGLFKNLIAYWIESYEFLTLESELKPSVHLRICSSVMNLISLIWPKVTKNESEESIQILQHITTKFPFGNRMTYRDDGVAKLLVGMNMKYCTIGFHLASYTGSDQGAFIIQSIADYIGKLLKSNPSVKDISCIPFKQLFMSIGSQSLMNALLRYQERLEDNMALSYNCFSLIKSFPQVDCSYAQKWILGLPKQLWKLKNHNEAFSVDICSFLKTSIIQVRHCDNDFVHKIQMALIPLFTSIDKSKALFTRLNVSLQMAILEILYYIPVWNDVITEKLLNCCFECTPDVNLRVFDMTRSSSLKCSLLIGYSLDQLRNLGRTIPKTKSTILDIEESECRLKKYQAIQHMARGLPSSCGDAVFEFWSEELLPLPPLGFAAFLDIIAQRSISIDTVPFFVSESIIDALALVHTDSSSRSTCVADSILRFLQNSRHLALFVQYCSQFPSSSRVQEALAFSENISN